MRLTQQQQKKMEQVKFMNNLKRLAVMALFISIVAQLNIYVAKKIDYAIKRNQIKKEILQCPPDCCKISADLSEYNVETPPQLILEELSVDITPIK